ncbi:hypothetical protein EI94DRAFT_1843047 [Lactarius quietus]|nr:hypothetical protein EI94DRAFT_1843047 [Lactarius quietus]
MKGVTNGATVIGDENQVTLEHSTTTGQSTRSAVAAQMVVPNQQSNILQPRNRKHTFAQVQDASDAYASSSSAMQANPVKRARTVGHGDNTHPLTQLENGNQTFLGPSVDDDGYVTDTYSIDDDDNEELSSKAPNKFSESLAIERPEWAASGSSEPANSASQESYSSVNDTNLCATMGHGLNSAVSTAGPSVVPTVTSVWDANLGWPVITELVYSSGTNKLMLTSQCPIVHVVIQEALDNLWAALLFNTAFPNAHVEQPTSPQGRNTMEILNQLENDQHYLMKITPLPCACICLICSEVKERCNTITMASFLALGQERNVIDYVSKQLSQYTYMFPGAAFANAPSDLMMRSRPYRNERIITVIRDMYFTGGSASFAKKYNYLFPIFEGRKGEMIEVPVPMVALVATALYATIYEWCTGEQQVMEFSANAYLNVYNGHVNTLNHIHDKCPARSMEMMGTLVFPSPTLIWTTWTADHIFVRSQHLPQHKIVPLLVNKYVLLADIRLRTIVFEISPDRLSGGLRKTRKINKLDLPPRSSDGVLSKATSFHRGSGVAHNSSSAPFFRGASLTKAQEHFLQVIFSGLPTSDRTPTTECRPPLGSDIEWARHSSLTNEQRFLYQSQAALIARISELERTLSSHSQSRFISHAASNGSPRNAEPSDEMLRIISDLKAERKELRRDIDGWRTRVADLEKSQVNRELALYFDTERRAAGHSSHVEKRAAVRAAKENNTAVEGLRAELTTTEADLRAAQAKAERNQEIAHELEHVRAEQAEERCIREDLDKSLEELNLIKTPTSAARRMMSIDSMSSATDVDSLDDHTMSGSELKAVQEEDEGEEVEWVTRTRKKATKRNFHLPYRIVVWLIGRYTPLYHSFAPAAHARHASLARGWSFPAKVAPLAASSQHAPDEVDRFFGCLEDIGDSPPISAAPLEATSPFTEGFFGAVDDEEDETPPFVKPADLSVEVKSPPIDGDSSRLSGWFIGEEDEGGMKFTFEIPPAFNTASTPVQARKPVPFRELAACNATFAIANPARNRTQVLRGVRQAVAFATTSLSRHGGARPSPPIKTIAPPTFIPQPSMSTKMRLPPLLRKCPVTSGAACSGLSNFKPLELHISLSWSMATTKRDSDVNDSEDKIETKKEVGSGGLVSRERQLARLRERMGQEVRTVPSPCGRCGPRRGSLTLIVVRR